MSIINFLKGQPSLHLLKVVSAELNAAKVGSQVEIQTDSFLHEAMQYGDDFGPEIFRKELAKFLSLHWLRNNDINLTNQIEIDENSIFITNGASNGIATIARCFLKNNIEKNENNINKNNIIWCENPT